MTINEGDVVVFPKKHKDFTVPDAHKNTWHKHLQMADLHAFMGDEDSNPIVAKRHKAVALKHYTTLRSIYDGKSADEVKSNSEDAMEASKRFDDPEITKKLQHLDVIPKNKKTSEKSEMETDHKVNTLMKKHKISENEEYINIDELFENLIQRINKSEKLTMSEENKEESSELKNEDVLSLFSGEELTEEVKEKIQTLYTAAVTLGVNEAVDSIVKELDEKFNEEIEAEKAKLHEEMEAKVSSYLELMAEQWINENKVALESAIKLQIFESFVSGMKTVFEEHYIEIPKEKVDMVAGLEEKVASLQEELNASMDARAVLNEEVKNMKKAQLIKESTEGLTAIDADKLSTLANDISFEDETKFSSKLNTIKESFFANASQEKGEVKAVVTDTPVIINEETKETSEVKAEIPADVLSFLNALQTVKK